MSEFAGTGIRTHRRFSPSKMERYGVCPGAHNLLERTPARERTVYATEGTEAHDILDAGLNTYCASAKEALDNSIHCVADIDDTTLAAVQDCLDYVWGIFEVINNQYGDLVMFTEQYVNPPIHILPGEAAGYCDIALFSRKARKLWIIDFKNGVGVVKEAEENKQMKQYGAGFLFDEDLKLVNPADVDTVVLVIVQPRAFHPKGPVRSWETTPGYLADYLFDLEEDIEKCLDPNAPLNPGVEQCQFCEARSVCPAIEARNLMVIHPQVRQVEQIPTIKLPDPKSLDVTRLSQVKQSFELLRIWMKGVDTHVDELLRSGVHVPGYKIVESEPRREWYGDEQDRVKKLAALIGCKEDDLYEKTLKPLTRVEPMVVSAFKERVGRTRRNKAAEEARQMFAYFTTKVSSGNLTVVKDDDERPAVNKALTSFSSIPQLPNPNNQ